MTFLFTCPHCGTQTDVYEEYAGHSGPCAVCGKPITVPYPPHLPHPPAATARARAAPAAERLRSATPVIVWVSVVVGGLLAVSALAVILFTLVFPAVSAARNAAHKIQSAKHLQRLALAMHEYAAEYGSFPPAYVADDKGKPRHGWRVLLLPQLGYRHLYERYDFSQPWDSPANMLLVSQMPKEYACPADEDALNRSETSYMVVVGNGTLFPGAKSTRPNDITDGMENTLLLAETANSGVCWLQPKDLDASRMRFRINGAAGTEIGSKHGGGAHIVTVDQQTHFLADDTPPEYVRWLTTISGSEAIPWDAFREP